MELMTALLSNHVFIAVLAILPIAALVFDVLRQVRSQSAGSERRLADSRHDLRGIEDCLVASRMVLAARG